MSAEVDLGCGEIEGGGLSVSSEEDGVGADDPVGLDEAVVSGGERGGKAQGERAGGFRSEGVGVDGSERAGGRRYCKSVCSKLVAA